MIADRLNIFTPTMSAASYYLRILLHGIFFVLSILVFIIDSTNFVGGRLKLLCATLEQFVCIAMMHFHLLLFYVQWVVIHLRECPLENIVLGTNRYGVRQSSSFSSLYAHFRVDVHITLIFY